MIPILRGHDYTKPIGYVEATPDGKLAVRFAENVYVTRELFFEIFGNVGCEITAHEERADGLVIIRAATILEFSL